MFKKTSQKLVPVGVLFFSILLVNCVGTAGAYTIMGNITSYHRHLYHITFNCENGKVRLSFLKDNLIRVHMAPASKDFPPDDLHLNENGPYAVVTYDWPGVPYKISEEFDFDLESQVYTIRADKLLVKVRKQPFKLAFYDAQGNLLVIEKEGIVNAGAIIPMMPQMSYIYENPPEPITLDIYPDNSAPSKYVMYDCQTVKSPVTQTTFNCAEDKISIEVSISASNVPYELWVHHEKEPASVLVDSKTLPKLKDKSGYDSARQGWYHGPGCFYGSDSIKTLNIKIPNTSKSHRIRIIK